MNVSMNSKTFHLINLINQQTLVDRDPPNWLPLGKEYLLPFASSLQTKNSEAESGLGYKYMLTIAAFICCKCSQGFLYKPWMKNLVEAGKTNALVHSEQQQRQHLLCG